MKVFQLKCGNDFNVFYSNLHIIYVIFIIIYNNDNIDLITKHGRHIDFAIGHKVLIKIIRHKFH